MIKVGIAGAAGRMGKALIKNVIDHPNMELVAAWEREGHENLGQDAGAIAGQQSLDIKISNNYKEEISKCEVVIDFTSPVATLELAQQASQAGVALVIGTTGFTEEEFEKLKDTTKQLKVVYATNFSVGINVLLVLAKKAAEILGENYNAEIIEAHHNFKKDSPSGTAVTLLEFISKGKQMSADKVGREGMIGARPQEEIGVHAVRAGDIVGDHTALFSGQGERLELKHQAHSRNTLSQGAIRAVAWIYDKKPGFYHMQDVLGIK